MNGARVADTKFTLWLAASENVCIYQIIVVSLACFFLVFQWYCANIMSLEDVDNLIRFVARSFYGPEYAVVTEALISLDLYALISDAESHY